jgi:hypothetical protein
VMVMAAALHRQLSTTNLFELGKRFRVSRLLAKDRDQWPEALLASSSRGVGRDTSEVLAIKQGNPRWHETPPPSHCLLTTPGACFSFPSSLVWR